MRIKTVLGACLAAVAGLLAVLLLDEGQRRAGSNYVPEHAPVTELTGGDRHCEAGVIVPGDAGALRLTIGTYGRPTPELRVTATASGRTVTSGRLPAGRREGPVIIPLRRVEETVEGAEVCVGVGRGGRNVLYGRGQNIRLAWLREGRESRLAMLPVVAHRVGLAKLNPFGSWLLPLLALALAAAWLIAIRLVVREAER